MPSRLSAALQSLDQTLDAPRRPGVALGNWRWQVRQRITEVRDALMAEVGAGGGDGWLAARGGSAFAERNTLLARLGSLGPQMLETADVEAARVDLKRLTIEIRRHAQRVAEQPTSVPAAPVTTGDADAGPV